MTTGEAKWGRKNQRKRKTKSSLNFRRVMASLNTNRMPRRRTGALGNREKRGKRGKEWAGDATPDPPNLKQMTAENSVLALNLPRLQLGCQ